MGWLKSCASWCSASLRTTRHAFFVFFLFVSYHRHSHSPKLWRLYSYRAVNRCSAYSWALTASPISDNPIQSALRAGLHICPRLVHCVRLTFRAPPLRYFSSKKLAHSTSKGAPLALTDFKVFSSASATLLPDFKGFHFYLRRSVALFFRPSRLQTVRECACVRPQWLYFQCFEWK